MKNISRHILRTIVAIIFISHGAIRAYSGTVTNFGEFLDGKGFPFGLVIAWAITIFELIGGGLLAANRFTLVIAGIFIVHQIMGISLVHVNYGWFVVGHGTGGMEYSVLLIATLLTLVGQNLGKAG